MLYTVTEKHWTDAVAGFPSLDICHWSVPFLCVFVSGFDECQGREK